jgi:hypothetical protein
MINIWRHFGRNDVPGVLIWLRSAGGTWSWVWMMRCVDVDLGALRVPMSDEWVLSVIDFVSYHLHFPWR